MADSKFEKLLFSSLIKQEEFARRVFPYLKAEYFSDLAGNKLYNIYERYFSKFNAPPTVETLRIEIDKVDAGIMTETAYASVNDIINYIEKNSSGQPENEEWLYKETEAWAQERALHNALTQAVSVYAGEHKTLSKAQLPDLLTDALSVAFEINLGHDYLEDAETRYNYMHLDKKRTPLPLETFNMITKGGVPDKTLTVFLAPTNVGKSWMLAQCAAHALQQGKNVLFISAEMADMDIGIRLDSMMLEMTTEEVEQLSKPEYLFRMKKIKNYATGKIKIKEYAPSSANVNHIRAYIKELKQKQKFIPDIIILDYLTVFTSSKVKARSDMFLYGKSLAEEFRALAVDMGVPVVTAAQFNRQGYGNSDTDLNNIAESFGIAMTADIMIAMIQTPELKEKGIVLCKELKNRIARKRQQFERFFIGVIQERMYFYDLDPQDAFDMNFAGTEDDEDDKPIMDDKFGNNKKKVDDLGQFFE